MTAGFWVGAAALAGIVVWMLLPSLLGRRARAAPAAANANLAVLRQQRAQLDADLAAGTLAADQHSAALEEIERRVLDEEGPVPAPMPAGGAVSPPPAATRSAWALVIALPLLAAGLYWKLGTPQGLQPIEPALAAGAGGGAASAPITAEDVQAMVAQLEKRMAERPDDLQGWLMLARSQAALQRYDEAGRAYARAAQLAPKDAQLLADQADTLAMAQGGTALGQPTTLIERALAIDPDNLKALALAGTAALERADPAAAVRYWSRASERVAPESELGKGLADGLQQARAQLAAGSAGGGSGGSAAQSAQPAPAAAGPTATSQQTAAGQAPPSASAPLAAAGNRVAQVSGRVALGPAIATRVAPTDTVFIVARAADGPRMPLAVLRRQASDLPIRFTLDDSMAMAPQMKLSAFPKVVVIARISKTGSANPSPDDLVVQSAPVDVGQQNIELVIERPAP